MEFQPLASSSAGCCYVLRSGDLRPLLLDCGIPSKNLEVACGFALSTFAGCLLSHAHGDHARSAEFLVKRCCSVYASSQTFDRLRLKSHRARVVRHDEQLSIHGWNVKPFEVVHDQPGTMGFVVEGVDGKAVYLTDSAYSPYRFNGVTHYALECNWSEDLIKRNHLEGHIDGSRFSRTVRTHMSLQRLIELLKANDLSSVQEIWLLHLSDRNSDEDEFRLAVQRATGLPVFVAPA